MNYPLVEAASVVVAAHTEDRWAEIVKATESAFAQRPAPLEVVLVIDHNPPLAQRARRELTRVVTVENDGPKGASSARNTGVRNSSGQVVVFLDDDQAAMKSNWLESLCRHLEDPEVLGVGGGVAPAWPAGRPYWFPGEFDWVVGASYIGMPETVGPIRNVWGGNTAMRRSMFLSVNGFRPDFGKVGHVSRPEDTDLCLRVRQAHPSGEWLYDPTAEVSHCVPLERTTRKYFLKRCWHEGRGKAALVRLVGPDGATSERQYATTVLPRAVIREFRAVVRHGERAALERCFAIVAGFLMTTAGWMAEKLAEACHASW